jgi:hypothetical protein
VAPGSRVANRLPEMDQLIGSLAAIGLLGVAGVGLWKSIDTTNPFAGSLYLLVAGLACGSVLELARRYERALKAK